MNKENIRKLITQKRNFLAPQEIREKSILIREKLFELNEFKNAKNVFCYLSFVSEVRTQEIIEKCFELKKTVLTCVVDEKTNEIIPVEFLGFDKLKKSSLGVMEPFPVKEFPFEKIDLVIVPGIAFDEELSRIGFGKGFFDRFIGHLLETTPTIALAFELQIVENIPATEFDKKVKKIVTEKKIIN